MINYFQKFFSHLSPPLNELISLQHFEIYTPIKPTANLEIYIIYQKKQDGQLYALITSLFLVSLTYFHHQQHFFTLFNHQ